jgi:histone H3/H4
LHYPTGGPYGAEGLASDLSAFAQHRRGKTINHEDVLLAVRNMPALIETVNAVG